jgi:peptidoglycan/LPS O-acetylase OafA/YrhL
VEPGETTKTRAPGLDGVRALAVLAVIGFHEGASELPGGFLGVDLFFVLSGFLITDLLVSRYVETGRLDVAGFWVRRARRLLPALAVMLVVVVAAATIIEPAQGASLRLALLAAATYTSNWYQILHHVSYFAGAGQLGAPPPLDHLWSLAIEEQFYLIWPVLLWLVVVRLPTRRARVAVALTGAAASALAMTLQYTPGGDPSAVYYGTDTHASALLIGAALALAFPLRTLVSAPPALARRMEAAGIAGLAVLAWSAGHFSGGNPAVYPVGLVLAALGAAGLVAAAAGQGVIAAMTSWRPLRWLGVRSYGIYLWHWPVIALGAALAGKGLTGTGAGSPWLWLAEIGVTVALAAASWRYVETPIMRDGLRVTVRRWAGLVAESSRRPAGTPGRARPAGTGGRAVPVTVTAVAAIAVVVAGYGVVRPPAPAAPGGLLQQVADGQRVIAASQATRAAGFAQPAGSAQPSASPRSSAAARSSAAPRPSGTRSTAPRAASAVSACRRGPHGVAGGQVTAVGDSVMLASASALERTMPGVYIDAKLGRQMSSGLAAIESLVAAGRLRPVVLIGLGTNGDVTAAQLRQLRRVIGPGRELVLVNTFGPESWEHEVNVALAASARHGRRTQLADWDTAIAARAGLLWPDGIHPRPPGATLYTHVALKAIKAGLSRGRIPACSAKS